MPSGFRAGAYTGRRAPFGLNKPLGKPQGGTPGTRGNWGVVAACNKIGCPEGLVG